MGALGSERIKILQWASSIPFKQHHREVRKDILSGTGEWLFKKPQFIEWRKSSAPSLLWVHGTRMIASMILFDLYTNDVCIVAGCGKTKLA